MRFVHRLFGRPQAPQPRDNGLDYEDCAMHEGEICVALTERDIAAMRAGHWRSRLIRADGNHPPVRVHVGRCVDGTRNSGAAIGEGWFDAPRIDPNCRLPRKKVSA